MNGNERLGLETHPADSEILAWLENELDPTAGEAVARHVDVCSRCAGVAREFDGDARVVRRAFDALAEQDSPDAYASILRAHGGRRARRATGVAALLATILAGAAAAMIPGSPVREWLEALTDRNVPAPYDQPAHEQHLSVLAPARIDVAIGAPSDSLEIRVSISAEPWLEVRTGPGERLDAVQLDEGRLTVAPGAARSLGITLPASSRLRIIIGRDTLLSRGGESSDGATEWVDTAIMVLPRASSAAGGASRS